MASDKDSLQPSNTVSNCELVKFVDNGFELEVNVSPSENTVWLTQQQMAELFNVDRSRVTRHISNAIKDGELSEQSNVRKTHFTGTFKPVNYCDLKVILDVLKYKAENKHFTTTKTRCTRCIFMYCKNHKPRCSFFLQVLPE